MEQTDLAAITTDQLEVALQGLEGEIGARRHLQLRLLSELDRRQVPLADGSRTMAEWVAARMDLTPDHAQRLTQTAARLADQVQLAGELAEGAVSFDRAVEESRLIAAGATPQQVAASRGFDLAGVRRMVARHRRMTCHDEQQVRASRFLSMQPTLDQSAYRMWGLFDGVDGKLVESALVERADQFPNLPDGRTQPRGQRLADALVAVSQDSLDGHQADGTNSGTPLVSIFVDASLAADTTGEAGAETDLGVRVGPLTLEEILCDGNVEILQTGVKGEPLTIGKTTRTIPPKLRRFILHRDGGACTADGCRSRYRLQPHHIVPRSHGGSHDPSNLTTLCCRSSFLRQYSSNTQSRRKDGTSYHHHVVIHRNGYRIDPQSPSQRRRFLKPAGRGPP